MPIFSHSFQSPLALIDPGGRRRLPRLLAALSAREQTRRPPWAPFLPELATMRRCLHGKRAVPIHTPAPWRLSDFPRDPFHETPRLAPRTSFPRTLPPEPR